MLQQVIYSNLPLHLHMHFLSSKVISLFMRLSHFLIFFQVTIHTKKVTLNTFKALEHQTLFQGNYASPQLSMPYTVSEDENYHFHSNSNSLIQALSPWDFGKQGIKDEIY